MQPGQGLHCTHPGGGRMGGGGGRRRAGAR
jgi:hypothetical protein